MAKALLAMRVVVDLADQVQEHNAQGAFAEQAEAWCRLEGALTAACAAAATFERLRRTDHQ